MYLCRLSVTKVKGLRDYKISYFYRPSAIYKSITLRFYEAICLIIQIIYLNSLSLISLSPKQYLVVICICSIFGIFLPIDSITYFSSSKIISGSLLSYSYSLSSKFVLKKPKDSFFLRVKT